MLAPGRPSGADGDSNFSLASEIIELVVLTSDHAFLETLRSALGPSRRLWHVPSSDKVGDLLLAGEVGIVVVDAQALDRPAAGYVSEIKRQFPGLVIVLAGDRAVETGLASLISSGAVYRFIHKPMSPGRAKLFVEAAVKRFEEQRPRHPLAARPAATAERPAAARGWMIGASMAAALAAVGVAFLIHRQAASGAAAATAGRSATPGAATADSATVLTRAAAALASNRLLEPSGDNALELYLQVLARNPADSAARAGIAEIHERLYARAESALMEERLDQAALAIETARKAGVESGRIALLTAELAKARTQIKAARNRAKGSSSSRAAASADPGAASAPPGRSPGP